MKRPWAVGCKRAISELRPPHRGGSNRHDDEDDDHRQSSHAFRARNRRAKNRRAARNSISHKAGTSAAYLLHFRRTRGVDRMRFIGRAVRVSLVAVAILAAYVAVFSVRVYARGYEKFFRNYLRWVVTPAPQSSTPKYVFFMVADHFEPDYDGARVARWSRRY